MAVKIYADTTTGFLHFDGSRISPKPLNGVCVELLHLIDHLELKLQEAIFFKRTVILGLCSNILG